MKINEAQSFADTWMASVSANETTKQLADRIGIHVRNLYARRRRAEAMLGKSLPTMTGDPGVAAREAIKQKFAVLSPRPTADDELPIEELIDRRLTDTRRRLVADSDREMVDISIDVSGPFGIALVGDPHIDNPGCNLKLLLDHTRVIAETDGMFAICVGDVQDNWIGRLARLWAFQGIASRESQRLVDYWLGLMGPKLLSLIYGNHDMWATGMHGESPLAWIERHHGTVAEAHGVRLRITSRDGEKVTVNARHDFPGRSQYNAAHGPSKSLLFGCRDDVAVAGHTHEFGRLSRLDPETRRPLHGVRLGSYKHSDDYAREKGLLDNNLSECCVLMVDPNEPDPRHRTWIEDNPFRAARVLTMMREDYSRGQNSDREKQARPGNRGNSRRAVGARAQRRNR